MHCKRLKFLCLPLLRAQQSFPHPTVYLPPWFSYRVQIAVWTFSSHNLAFPLILRSGAGQASIAAIAMLLSLTVSSHTFAFHLLTSRPVSSFWTGTMHRIKATNFLPLCAAAAFDCPALGFFVSALAGSILGKERLHLQSIGNGASLYFPEDVFYSTAMAGS